MNKYRAQIEMLMPSAETGAQWAEICRLEVLAIAEEMADKSDLRVSERLSLIEGAISRRDSALSHRNA